ncbi:MULTISPECIES: Asp23/Gls24 family envelope stress response protein [Bacillales]|jgi:uncharacterized alkaline shock family protein YloU|uniref:Asp23/Gls24 family envelope stress response protein n=1 Tax=Brevibacillus aydinogluensis TaxID=927786 RepID=A0AA48M868_9BACL|nr:MULTISPECIES: Asp23/Gls24 family envelope stress response protein [Bacillales]REK62408.1 MAG: Asp23/Gls24 family envelope stress response protein [Brevibacillus sp.]MBR8659152.1 Asp23/Gls24 family envelope stress response protein [Brevibacillus sp. NL20B1]MDT3415181.1 putative alkaline shock family protein YloU [Brevibacillus aydinogluensis]NNV02805.1 Asp23/Gls24 family envelope stress response protein [Brevibacillus sp. MCWH]UFJ60286.1 Asp23/Gls24 family envelope stress response protein [A
MEERRGEIRVADQVVAVIAGTAAGEVSGISVHSGGLYQDLAKRISGGTKGITVSLVDGRASIEIRVSVKYGLPIHHVCRQLQEKVKEIVESLTGLCVEAVHVRVDAIDLT